MIFGAPLFLWGLLALAIPIAVHLFQFRRYRKVYFSNVDRLESLQTESRRQSNLRRWLVLLMRCLAIVFLVLAFAQPSLPDSGQKLRSGATVVSVYLDNSFSMENSTSDGSQLEAAKQKAREIAAAYRPGDRYQLLSNAMSGDEYRWLSREEFLDAVDLLAITPASRRLSEVAASQSDFMRQSGAANRHAYLVSDFQRSAADLDALPDDSLSSSPSCPSKAWPPTTSISTPCASTPRPTSSAAASAWKPPCATAAPPTPKNYPCASPWAAANAPSPPSTSPPAPPPRPPSASPSTAPDGSTAASTSPTTPSPSTTATTSPSLPAAASACCRSMPAPPTTTSAASSPTIPPSPTRPPPSPPTSRRSTSSFSTSPAPSPPARPRPSPRGSSRAAH
ncbi:MAG: BatA and WFA domain-containing protein [Bacteroidales bacterium]|nr:BatA and WFA domain-containing protein [Bacteroidales bacterium]